MTDFNNNLHENEKFVDPLHKYTATVWKHYQFKTLKNNKAYRPNAHLLYIVMHYNGNII